MRTKADSRPPPEPVEGLSGRRRAEAGIELRLESNVTAIDAKARHVGHAEQWDEISVDGDIAAKDCLLRYKSGGRVLAVASIYRDLASPRAELAMEQAVK
jgi:hypothetical protein